MRVSFNFIPVLILFLISLPGISQTPVSGILNEYAKVTSIVNTSTVGIGHQDLSKFHAGDTVLIVQMKGADFEPNLNTLGFTGMHSAGRYEFIAIESIDTVANEISFRANLINSYDVSESVQLVRVPSYQSAVVTGTLSCSPWNGSSGGILALFANDTIDLKADIDVTGKGFMGGDTTYYTGTCESVAGSLHYSNSATDSAGLKGEGMIWSSFVLTRGKGGIANAGGGGDGKYSGGGGGAGYGKGGSGGRESTTCGTDPDPSGSSGGLGGNTSTPDFGNESDTTLRDRIFMGGGGGAGSGPLHSEGSQGGGGGGIIFLITRYLKTNNHAIISNGADVMATARNDAGAGGGGGGGTVIIAADTLTGTFNVFVNGGKGGNTANCSGQGGGGGGGFVWTSSPGFSYDNVTSQGGNAGTTLGCSLVMAFPGNPGDSASNLKPVLNGFLYNIIGGQDTICYGEIPNKLGGSTPRGGNGQFTFQWQSRLTNSSWTNIPGANQKDYISTPLFDTTYFRRVVTSLRFKGADPSDIVADTSKSVIVNVIPEIKSFDIAPDTTICYGQNPVYIRGAQPTGGDGTGHWTFAWQESPDSTTWNDLQDTGLNYSKTSNQQTAFYKRIVYNNICKRQDVIKITVYPLIGSDSVWSSQPICYGTKPGLINGSNPQGGSGTYSYQWQQSADNLSWTDTAALSRDLTLGTRTQTIYYRRIVWSGLYNTCSDTAQSIVIHVVPLITNNSIQSDQTICAYTAPASFTGSMPGGGDGVFTYQWEKSTNQIAWDSLATSVSLANYQSDSLQNTSYFRRIVRSGLNDVCRDTSTILTVTVQPRIENNTISADTTLCYDQIPVPLVQYGSPPTGGDLTNYFYQWQSRTDKTSWSDLPGQNTGSSYQSGALTSTTYFRRMVTSGACISRSDSLMVNVLPSISNNIIVGRSEVCVDSAAIPLAGSKPAGGQDGQYIYSWQDSTASGTWQTIAGASGIDYGPGILPESTWYRRIVTSGLHNCCLDESSAYKVNLIQLPVSNGAGDNMTDTFKFSLYLNAPDPQLGTGFWSTANQQIAIADTLDEGTKVSNLSLGKNTFFWTVMTSRVCPVHTDSMTVIVKDLVRYNGFSPNNDGVNDYFVLDGLQNVDQDVKRELRVFNRWGNVVYSSDYYDNKWNGTNQNGNPLPDDTYYYILKVTFKDSKTREYKGFVVLKR